MLFLNLLKPKNILTPTTTIYYKGVLYISQSSKARASPSDYLMSYPHHSLVAVVYRTAKMQPVCSTAPANWAVVFSNTNSMNRKRLCNELNNAFILRLQLSLHICIVFKEFVAHGYMISRICLLILWLLGVITIKEYSTLSKPCQQGVLKYCNCLQGGTIKLSS